MLLLLNKLKYPRIGSEKLKFCTLASGSSGNCMLVSYESTHILIDAGISMRRTALSLKNLGLHPTDLSGILITHEHSDHVKGLVNLTKHFALPVYAAHKTASALISSVPELCETICDFRAGDSFGLGSVEVHSFRTPHDTPESVGYRLCARGRSLALVTDLGCVPRSVLEAVSGCDAVVLESNYDVEMLRMGKYPPFLKKRILGDRGHLSNEAGAQFAMALVESGTRRLVLAHLSRDNNTPELAFSSVNSHLRRGSAILGRDFEMSVAPRDTMGIRYSL